MKKTGFILIAIGFLLGSVISVTDAVIVNWVNYSIAFLVCLTGVAIIRYANARHTKSDMAIAENMQNVRISIENIDKNMKILQERSLNINVYDILKVIDELFPDEINTFVESRKSIAYAYGLQAYADVMNHFAAGERYLNRVWSTSADGYIDEANIYIEKSGEQFKKAKELLEDIEKGNYK